MRILVGALWVLGLCTVAGCTEANPLYCQTNQDCRDSSRPFCDVTGAYSADQKGNRCIGVPLDGGGAVCESSAECTEAADLPICDPDFMICLRCEDSASGDAACLAKDTQAPVCAADGRCVGCETGLDCPDQTPICGAAETCGPCTPGTEGDAACTSRDQTAPFCLDGACVQCTDDSECGAAAPVCDDVTHECRPCGAHTECDDEICNPIDGSCVPNGDIVYVARDGTDGSGCGGPTSPCASVSLASGALSKTSVTRSWIKLRTGTPYSESIRIDTGATITLVGVPETVVVSPAASSNTPGLLVANGSNVTAMDIDFANATGGIQADGVRCEQSTIFLLRITARGNNGNGVDVNECTLARIERSLIHSNVAGGITIDDSGFAIRNNFVVNNGNAATSLVGGVDISNASAVDVQLFEFNTVAVNQAKVGDPSGVGCSTSSALTASSNIVYGGIGDPRSHGGSCAWKYSNLEGSSLAGSDGNIDEDPLFANSSLMNYHLQANSPCLDAADPTATLDVDFDGDPRPGPGRAMGADEP